MNKDKQVRKIKVVPHNPKWHEEYLQEVEKIHSILHRETVDIHHIGSTAIPQIYAKPIIDILVEVTDINNIDKYNKDMEELEYIAKGEYGIVGRRFFLKGVRKRTHHIHIFQTGNFEIKRHLAFRDYMIAHPQEAKHYDELKKELAKRFRYDIEGYCDGKKNYIKDVDKKAKEWSRKK